MGYKIAVIIVIFQLIAGLVVNILLLQNEKQYSIKSCSMGFQTFCFISLVLFAHKVPLLYLFFVYQSAFGCQSAHWQASVEAAKAESLEYAHCLFVLVATAPLLFIYKFEHSPFRLTIKVEWVISNWKRAPPLRSVVTCALRNTPQNEHSSFHSHCLCSFLA